MAGLSSTGTSTRTPSSRPSGRLLNWNNQSAPGFMHGDDEPYGSVHRVELFDQLPDTVELADVVSVMNRAATEDVRSPVWPVVSEVLAGGTAPNGSRPRSWPCSTTGWPTTPRASTPTTTVCRRARARLMIDELFGPIADAVRAPVFGDPDRRRCACSRGIDDASFVDKDLRTVAR